MCATFNYQNFPCGIDHGQKAETSVTAVKTSMTGGMYYSAARLKHPRFCPMKSNFKTRSTFHLHPIIAYSVTTGHENLNKPSNIRGPNNRSALYFKATCTCWLTAAFLKRNETDGEGE